LTETYRKMNLIHKEITDKILNAFYTVYSELDYGFLEKGYENALCVELENLGMSFEKQKSIQVFIKIRWSENILPTSYLKIK